MLTTILFQMLEYVGYRRGLHSVWQTHTLVLGRPSGRHVEVFVQIPILGRKYSRHRTLCEALRLPLHSKQRYSEILIGADYERTENYEHASGTFSVPRQRFIPTVRVWANSRQVVVPALFQYARESRLCRENPRNNIMT